MFLDSDQIVMPDTIEKCVERCEDSVDALILNEGSIARTFWARCIAYERTMFMGDDDPLLGVELPRFFSREVFKKVKPEDDMLFHEHWDIYFKTVKHGFKVSRVNAWVKHHEPESLKTIIRKYYRYGKSYPQAYRKLAE